MLRCFLGCFCFLLFSLLFSPRAFITIHHQQHLPRAYDRENETPLKTNPPPFTQVEIGTVPHHTNTQTHKHHKIPQNHAQKCTSKKAKSQKNPACQSKPHHVSCTNNHITSTKYHRPQTTDHRNVFYSTKQRFFCCVAERLSLPPPPDLS